ncbi:MAG: HAD family hydrolase [Gammaproteobacteria bacterium]
MSFLNCFDAIIFDLNGTLAEDFDRFGPGHDYMATYTKLGGRHLSGTELRDLVDDLMSRFLQRYDADPTDPFPQLCEFLEVPEALPSRELHLLEALVAEHEIGVISAARIELLRRFSRTHRLGLISDLWAPSHRYRAYLDALGVTSLFGSMLFSCEQGAVKPSPRLFRCALEELGVAPEQAVFVGDKETRDVIGAASCGMATVWVDATGEGPRLSQPDRVVASVEALEALV